MEKEEELTTIKTECLVNLEGKPLELQAKRKDLPDLKKIRERAWESGARFKQGLKNANAL